jgi:biopolymer transport protein ExbD
MTPLIDVVFLLLVFFMLTSAFLVPEAIELELPSSSSAEKANQTPIVVILGGDGQLLLNGQEVSLEELKRRIEHLLSGNPEQQITLKSDARVAVQDLLGVMDQIRSAGGHHIALATQPTL